MRPPRIYRVDDQGEAIVKVELVNRPSLFVTINAEDFDRLVAAGHGPRWFLNDNAFGAFYVKCVQPDVAGRLVAVARLVAGAGIGETVRYRNRDRLDLRRSNLVVVAGRAAGQTPLKSPQPDQPTRDRVSSETPAEWEQLSRLFLGSGLDQRPSGDMGMPEASFGLSFAPA